MKLNQYPQDNQTFVYPLLGKAKKEFYTNQNVDGI